MVDGCIATCTITRFQLRSSNLRGYNSMMMAKNWRGGAKNGTKRSRKDKDKARKQVQLATGTVAFGTGIAARVWLSMDIPVWPKSAELVRGYSSLLTLSSIGSFVYPNQSVCQLKHVVSARYQIHPHSDIQKSIPE